MLDLGEGLSHPVAHLGCVDVVFHPVLVRLAQRAKRAWARGLGLRRGQGQIPAVQPCLDGEGDPLYGLPAEASPEFAEPRRLAMGVHGLLAAAFALGVAPGAEEPFALQPQPVDPKGVLAEPGHVARLLDLLKPFDHPAGRDGNLQ